MSEVEIEALRRKVTTPRETVEVLTGNDLVEGSDVTAGIETELEQNYHAAVGGTEGIDELHQNDHTQRLRRMMQENSTDPIPSLRG